MDERLARLEAEVATLRDLLRSLEGRVSALEAGAPAPSAAGAGGIREAARKEERAGRAGAAGAVPLLGRTLLVFGGAYLLRALAESGLVPLPIGILLGLAYALAWLVAADRAARSAAGRLSAGFHGAAALLIALPILWEAAVRFRLQSADGVVPAVGLVTLLALSVAVRRRLPAVAWTATGAGTAAALALMRASETALPQVACLAALGVAALWAAYLRGWVLLPWVAAAAADAGLAVLTAGATTGRGGAPALPLVAVLTAFFAAYLTSFAGRSFLQRRQVGSFEVVQTGMALLVGFYGAVRVSRFAGLPVAGLGLAGLALALGAYAAAFSPALRAERRRDFFFYTTLALVLVLMASRLFLPASGLAVAWSLAAMVGATLSARFGRVTLNLHRAVYLGAAAAVSGLLPAGVSAFAASTAGTWHPVTAGAWVVLAGVAGYLLIPVARASARWGGAARLPGLAVLTLALWGGGGALISLLAPALAGAPGPAADAGLLAALRTATLAAAATLLAWAGGTERCREAAWLVAPLLVATGLKLLVEDFPRGRALTMFVALVALGAALIATSRLARRGASPRRRAG